MLNLSHTHTNRAALLLSSSCSSFTCISILTVLLANSSNVINIINQRLPITNQNSAISIANKHQALQSLAFTLQQRSASGSPIYRLANQSIRASEHQSIRASEHQS